MSNVIVVAEVKNGQLKKVSKELITAGHAVAAGGKVTALLFGDKGLAAELGAAGADEVLVSNAPYSPEGWASIIAQAAKDKSAGAVLAGHTYSGKDFAPRVAARLNAALIADVVEVSAEGGKLKAKKPVFSGKASATIQANTDVAVVTIRPNSITIAEKASAGAVADAPAATAAQSTVFASVAETGGSKIQLGEANIIVSGGRGMKDGKNFPMLQELCDVIGAALGASRAAVDSGFIDHSHQVGQTGKTVSPNLYIACGISGAIQHLAGMGSSKNIVAINTNPDAPIFKVTTYGVVADLFEVVPALTKEFKSVLG